jgi:Domain of unknown function (DUF4277)
MSLTWCGPAVDQDTTNLGPLAVIAPLLERMDLAALIDRHLPADPQQEFSHGHVLRALLAARLCNPVALVNVAAWAQDSGVEFLWNLPPDKLNDDRLGRSLDAFFKQRHSILASVAAHLIDAFQLPTTRLHYDLTHLLFMGAYAGSCALPQDLALPPTTSSASYPPAHITHGYLDKHKMIHVGLCSIVDDLGAVPLLGHTLSGNHNGQTGIAQQFHLLQEYLHPQPLLLISDRGTYSAAHLGRLQRAGHTALCSVAWKDVRALFAQNRPNLHWQRASFLSIEQQRRCATGSSLPREHYELAVLKHRVTDPDTKEDIPCRMIFVFSTADQKAQQQNRAAAIAKIRQGLEQVAHVVWRAHPNTDLATIPARVAKLFGKKEAARYFQWELVALSAAEQAALPTPAPGCRRPTHRFVFTFDAAAAQADAADDGYFALITTAALTSSADLLFTQFKQQNYVEQAHHQWKTPLAVRPVFLKSVQRVEALVALMQLALTAYHLLQRLYRQAVPADAPVSDKRTTTETILRAFRCCPLKISRSRLGRVVHATRLTSRQRTILERLGFATPAQLLASRLPRHPPPE